MCDMCDAENKLKKKIIEALSKIKPSFQEVLVMSLYEEMSNKDIAEELGINKWIVMVRLYRAKIALRKKMIELEETNKKKE